MYARSGHTPLTIHRNREEVDREQFIEEMLPLQTRLYGFAFRMLRAREEAEDAVQDIFVKLWKRRKELSKYKSIEAFAMTVTRNHCLDLLRKHRTVSLEEQEQLMYTRGHDHTPEKLLEEAESYLQVKRIIDELPEQYRTVLVMRDRDGYGYEEIAEVMDTNINTLRVNLSRARKMVREEMLKQQEYGRTTHSGALG